MTKPTLELFYDCVGKKVFDEFEAEFYANNLDYDGFGLVCEYIVDYFEDYHIAAVSKAFPWSNTRNGREFWVEINLKWAKYFAKHCVD